MTTDLKGQNIVITGSGGGLGEGYAKAAAALGANIVINDINAGNAAKVVDEIRAAGGNAVAEVGNIVDPVFAEALIQRCITEFGSITDLVGEPRQAEGGARCERDRDLQLCPLGGRPDDGTEER